MSKKREPDFIFILIVNATCIALAAGAASIFQGVSFGSVCFITAILMLLCNEAWYRCAAIPVLLVAAVNMFRKDSAKKEEKQTRQALRLCSISLLVVPHLIFALLYLANWATQGQAEAELGIGIRHGVLACIYIAPALLWLAAQFAGIFPLSIEQLFMHDDGIISEPTEGEDAAPEPPVPTDTAAPIHPQLKALADELLHYSRPELGVNHIHARTHATIGYCLLPIVLILIALAANSYEQSVLISGITGLLAIIFGLVSYRLINEPNAWRKKLSQVEYAYTATHAYIAEGDKLQTFSIDESLNIQFEAIEGHIGNIYLSQSGKLGTRMRKLLGDKLTINDTGSRYDLHAPLCGFFQIPHAEQVLKQLSELRQSKCP